jgi:hypothetical protein
MEKFNFDHEQRNIIKAARISDERWNNIVRAIYEHAKQHAPLKEYPASKMIEHMVYAFANNITEAIAIAITCLDAPTIYESYKFKEDLLDGAWDCDNCPISGKCDIEETVRGLKEKK